MANSYTIEQVGAGAYIARTVDGRRTMLKASPEWARRDAENERFVCDRWPLCSHRDAEHCGRATARALPRWRAETIDSR